MSEITVLTKNNFDEMIANGTVVVDFYADWCGPCQMMVPLFAEANADYEGRVLFAKVNVDEASDIAVSYNIMSIPTLLFFKGGKLCERLTGVIEKSAFYEKIDALLKA